MRSTVLLTCLLATSLSTDLASATVTQQEAQQLKTTLTPFGAEKAGNKDGTIPPWTGGFTQLPAGVKATGPMPDFFASDPKRLTINAANASQYADKLSDGTMRMLKGMPGFHIDVYPTHRTASAPQWFYDGTFANATAAKLIDNNWVGGAQPGIPFPIPKNGKEVALNGDLNWRGTQTQATTATYIIGPSGGAEFAAETKDYRWEPYNDPSNVNGPDRNYYLLAREDTIGPPNRVGETILSWQTFNEELAPQLTWQYLVGQRRLRKAPQVTYDGAYPDCGGIVTDDELDVWNGPPDRYDMTIVGKKEMFVPYNNNKIAHDTQARLLGPRYLNPDDIRWELHRVWVVSFTLAPGKRHLLPYRTVYFDEDSWAPTLADDYDSGHTLWKSTQGYQNVNPGFPASYVSSQATFDMKGGGYCAERMVTTDRPGEHPAVPLLPAQPPSFFQPGTIAAEAVR